jgi:murein DD-endopeptidase MepM/ murein hydrolase activator NlpD
MNFRLKNSPQYAIIESISTIVRQFKDGQKALSLGTALFLVLGALVFSTLGHKDQFAGTSGILGGPSLVGDPGGQDVPEATLSSFGMAILTANASTPPPAIDSLSTASLEDTNSPFSSVSSQIGQDAAGNEALDGGSGSSPKALPKLAHYFIQPAAGLNWGILHAHNAVDIANVCGTPVVAAADGAVVDRDDSGSWNGGYGNFIVIEHSNGTKTKYAHLETLTVGIGDEVSQGQNIGTIGNTGHVTGCHLHFEVYGAVNPFAKR